jgi:glutamate carboxypeptidase
MQYYGPFLSWIDHQREHMIALTESWANINSGSKNLEGLAKQLKACKEAFSPLGGEINELTLPPYMHIDDFGNRLSSPLGKALHIVKRPEAKIRLLFSGHMDTVYGQTNPFQKAVRKNEEILNGPGVADMKGGLVILLTALQAFEKSPFATKIGWEVLISPDEEIGSPGSRSILERAAKRNDFALIFEPSFSDGAFVSSRGGSQNFTLVVHGKAAHAGRDFRLGRSALTAACSFVTDLEQLNLQDALPEDEIVINVGELHSGQGFNVVPNLAICKINLRAATLASMEEAKKKMYKLVDAHGTQDGISMHLHEGSARLPKIIDKHTEELFQWISNCANDLGQKIAMRPTKGVSDGNILSNFGLANIDTLGAIGGNIHTPEEYINVSSLVQRAKLCALLLMKVSNSEFNFQGKSNVINL